MTDILRRLREPPFGVEASERNLFMEAANRIAELEAENTQFAKFLLELRENLALFVDEIEDEGDRVYLGSTNHADYLREAEARMTEIWHEQEEPILLGSQGRDVFAEMKALRGHATALDGLAKEARRAIGDHSVPDDCYATGPLTGGPVRDLVQCPACSFIAMYDAVSAMNNLGEAPF